MNRQKLPQIIAIAFFAALLAIPFAIQKSRQRDADAPASANVAMKRYGFALQDDAEKAGIRFVHQPPKLDAKLAHIMPQIASMGAGVAVADFDRDGFDDFYVTNSGAGSLNQLYRNNGDGTFSDVAPQMKVAALNQGRGASMGAVWGDYDNDNYEDLLVYKWGRPLLFHNDEGKGFSEVKNSGMPDWVNANNAIWFDYDRDGKLDLFIGGYYPEKVDLWNLKNTSIMPDSFEYAKNGGRKYLLRGRGDGTFEDVTEAMGLKSRRWTLAAAAADLRGTGYPDLFIANDYGVAELWANQNGKKFVEIGGATGVGYAPKSGMNAAFGDVNNSGQFAIYVSNISEQGVLLQGNNLWVPQPGTNGSKIKYTNLAREMGVELGGWSFGAQFGDLNNDGNQDIFLTNGYVSGDKDKSYWYDYSKITGGNSSIISDAANWPPMKGRSLSGYQAKHLWLSDGASHFTEVAQAVGATDRLDGRAVALADFANNGALDILEANQNGPLKFYRNQIAPGRTWVELTLEGTKSNRSAIGAQVVLHWKNGGGVQQQLQEISGGSGFCAQNSRRLHFGLGEGATLEKAEIRWPSGSRQTLTDLKIGQINAVKER